MGLLYDYHELLNLQFVKVTYGYVKKAEPKPCLMLINKSIQSAFRLAIWLAITTASPSTTWSFITHISDIIAISIQLLCSWLCGLKKRRGVLTPRLI
jgi:hypothetical protein